MADAALISFAVEKLGDALIHQVKFLKGVAKQVEWLKDELESMQCFLKDAAEKQGHDERVRKWISDVREAAQDAEDAIEIFTLKLDTPRETCFPASHVCLLNRVGKEIESIRSRLDEIAKRRERYGIQNLGEVGMESSTWRSRSEMVELRRRMAIRFQKDKDVVGLNEDADLLLNKVILDEGTEGLSLAAIVGMGGIGKSTLARKIYNHPDVAARFEKRAWVVVTSEFAAEEIMKEIIQELSFSLNRAEVETLEDTKHKLSRSERLQIMLRERLEGKRYFIVLDDMWEDEHWEALENAFPKDKASRLLFTSRNQVITEHQGYVHRMKFLNPKESWELLLKTSLIGGSVERLPQKLEEIGREIYKLCGGLPLAIAVAGGLLVNEGKSERGWQKVLKQMKEYHLESSKIGSNVSAILELSYHNLPSQLKPCFLCLSFFEKGAVIQAKRLVHIWVALGLVQAAGEENVEEIGRSYLDELINRNLILVEGRMSTEDRAKYCYVHDLLRELSIRKAKEEIGFKSLIREDEGSSSSSSSSSSYKPRHCVDRGIEKRLIQVDTVNQNKHVRTLFIRADEVPRYDDAYFSTPSYWKGFELLRILDIECSTLRRLPSTIRALIGVRYLRLREESGVLKLPSWLDDLKNLEVLDLAYCARVRLQDVTWKMDNLRHFYINRRCIFSNPMNISSWKNLRTLKYMWSDNFLFDNAVRGLGLPRLRKLGVAVDKNGGVGMRRLLREIISVEVLHIRWFVLKDDIFPFPDSLDHLIKLKLKGPMNWCPIADKFPQNITHLTLSRSGKIMNDPMQELGKLPKLVFLKLDDRVNIESMKVSHDGFHNLVVLHLGRMPMLKNMEVEEGGIPELQRLQIHECPKLQIENLRKHLTYAEIIIINVA